MKHVPKRGYNTVLQLWAPITTKGVPSKCGRIFGSCRPPSTTTVPPGGRVHPSPSLSPLHTAMIFYVFFLALAAVPAAVAQSANANCTDLPTYNWVSALVVSIVPNLLSINLRYIIRSPRVLVLLSRI